MAAILKRVVEIQNIFLGGQYQQDKRGFSQVSFKPLQGLLNYDFFSSNILTETNWRKTKLDRHRLYLISC